MATSERPTSEQVLHHLGYEWWMFRNTLWILQRLEQRKSDPVRNAIVESLVVHGRNLGEFFFASSYYDAGAKLLGLEREKAPREVGIWIEMASRRALHMQAPRFVADKLEEVDVMPVFDHFARMIQKVVDRASPALPETWLGFQREGTGLLFLSSAGSDVQPLGPVGMTGAPGNYGKV